MAGRERARALEDHGLEGCAHARPGTKRQVLFASQQHIDAVGVDPGAIRENFTVSGADVQGWAPGQRLAVGDAVFEVTMECEPCERMDELRPGLRAELEGRRGVLAKVVETGEVAVGDEIRLL
jgi:MOSC domain-containing protein YiiM